MNEAYKAGNKKYVDKNAFRQMMMKKGFNGPGFLANRKKAGSPKPQGNTKFDRLYQDKKKREEMLESEAKQQQNKEKKDCTFKP